MNDATPQMYTAPEEMNSTPAVVVPPPAPNATPTPKETSVANKFVSFMEKIGHDAKVILGDVVKYLPAAAGLASIIFPAEKAQIANVVTATQLIQNAVTVVEQKYAASGIQNGTGAQKLAEVLTLTEQQVTTELQAAGITADTSYVTNIVNAVVAILNVQTQPSTTP